MGITAAWDAVPTHQLQSALTLLQPRSLPVPRSQPQRNRTSLPGVVALASAAIPPPHPLSQSDTNGKRPAQKTPVNSTPPVSSSRFDGFHSLTGSHSEATELQPPSITSTPLGLGTPRQWRSTSKERRCSLALLYSNPGFNLLGHPVAGPSNLTPSVHSLAGSHMSSTWPAGVFTSGPSSPHLTINQANSLYKLAAECQALSVKLAKKCQVLLGLEAMHCNSIQGMAHETLTLRCSAQEAAYSAIMWDRVPDNEHEATTHRLHSEANVAWKEMHEVMYNHQLHYDGQLATFLADAKMALDDM